MSLISLDANYFDTSKSKPAKFVHEGGAYIVHHKGEYYRRVYGSGGCDECEAQMICASLKYDVASGKGRFLCCLNMTYPLLMRGGVKMIRHIPIEYSKLPRQLYFGDMNLNSPALRGIRSHIAQRIRAKRNERRNKQCMIVE